MTNNKNNLYREKRANLIGMPDSHAMKFSFVAQSQKSVIMSRAVGGTCRQLLEQGYDTKGFRVHGKSCNWGPMAGFVMADPRLNKYGMDKAKYNSEEHFTAMHDIPEWNEGKKINNGSGWKASYTPLKLYQERVDWLLENLTVLKIKLKKMDKVLGGKPYYKGEATHESESGRIRFMFVLREEVVNGQKVWGAYFDYGTKPEYAYRQNIMIDRPDNKKSYEPMLAMTNPKDHRSFPGEHFLNAITGDYDLFAIWSYNRDKYFQLFPKANRNEDPPLYYDHDGYDRRLLGVALGWSEREKYETEYEAFFTQLSNGQYQGTKLGNITNRIYMLSQLLNSEISTARSTGSSKLWGPFPNRFVCWHSDESARPFVNDVDLPFIAFLSSGGEVIVETISEFKAFISYCLKEDIHVTLAEGWTLNPEGDKQNRLGRRYEELIPTWERDSSGRPIKAHIPSFYNS